VFRIPESEESSSSDDEEEVSVQNPAKIRKRKYILSSFPFLYLLPFCFFVIIFLDSLYSLNCLCLFHLVSCLHLFHFLFDKSAMVALVPPGRCIVTFN